MKMIEADGAAVRGPFKQVQQIPVTATVVVSSAARL